MYKLCKDVFYRLYGEYLVLYKTDSSEILVLDHDAINIISLFSKDVWAPSNKIDDDSINVLLENNIIYKKYEHIETKNDIESQYSIINDYSYIKSAMFELTYRCNEKCSYCYCVVDKNKTELTKEEIFNAIDQLKELGCLELTFTGGDPFIRNDFMEIVEYAYKLDFVINIFTNGNLITDEMLIKLRSFHLRSLHFSIYSDNAYEHDQFTHLKGSFDKTIDTIKKAKLIGIPVNIKTSILNFNYKKIDKIIDLASELGSTIQVNMTISSKNDGDKITKQYSINEVEEYYYVMKKVGSLIKINQMDDLIPINDSNRDGICGAGKKSININPYGDINPCNSLLINCGNIKEQSLKDIWFNNENLQKVRNFSMEIVEGCENCMSKNYCNFCPGISMLENGKLKKYNEACKIEFIKNVLKEKKND